MNRYDSYDRILFWLLGVIFASWAILSWLAYNSYSHQKQDFINEREAAISGLYKMQFRAGEDVTKVVMAAIMDEPSISKLVTSGLENPQDNTIRQKLHTMLTPLYESLKGIGIKQLHFHTADSVSYLRMHQPQNYGDSLMGIRPTVDAANKTQKYVCGFEEGRIFNGFRYVYPLFDGNRHIGSVETSIHASKIMDGMMKDSGAFYQMVFSKEIVQNTVWQKEFEKNYKISALSKAFVVETTQNIGSRLLNEIDTQITAQATNEMQTYQPFVLQATFEDEDYVITFMPIKNFDGKYVGFVIQYLKDNHLAFIYDILVKRMVMAAIFGIVIFIFAYRLLKEMRKRKDAQRELANLNANLKEEVDKQTSRLLEQAQVINKQAKYAAMGEMIAAIAHQWRQPLNSLSLYVGELNIKSSIIGSISAADIRETTSEMGAQIEYMANTIDDFKNFFKVDKKAKIMFVKEIVNKSIALLQKQLDMYFINVNVKGDDFEALIIANELEQVIINIVNNAKDQILITEAENKSIDIILDSINKQIIVKDYAGGIATNRIDDIFKPDFSQKGESGTGLGLYMAQIIVEQHFDGYISAYNEENGAVFVIGLK